MPLKFIRWRGAGRSAIAVLALAILAAVPAGCGWGSSYYSSPYPLVYGVTTGGDLVAFRTGDPGWIEDSVPITGLQPAETLVGIDFRPADGLLYGVGDTARLYTISRSTGLATEVGLVPFGVLLGSSFGMDVNPVTDVIRLVSDAEQNLRIDPETGLLVATDTNLSYDAGDPNFGTNPGVVAAAYTNNFSSATTTTLFGIDADLDVLVRQGSLDGVGISPNTGLLFTVGSLGVNAGTLVGFDIRWNGFEDRAYAALMTPGSASTLLFRVSLSTGTPTFLGEIGSVDPVTAIAVRP